MCTTSLQTHEPPLTTAKIISNLLWLKDKIIIVLRKYKIA